MDSDLTGHTLGGRYDVLALLGAGGMGAVYRARDRELDELVALKVIRRELARDPDIVERFRQEVRLARRVTHGNVARTYELGNADGQLYCTMELIDGVPLSRRLAQGPLPLAEAVAITGALCEALAAAHAVDVIHRDVKPDNVMLAAGGRVVMADFGIAALKVDDGDASGTPAYMAPEQSRGEPPSPAADIYAVGLILFEMLVGRRAFVGSALEIATAKQERAHVELPGDVVPTGLAEVITRATARDPEHRFRTAAGLRAALAPWLRAPRAITAEPRPSIPRLTSVRTIVALAPEVVRPGAPIYLAEAVRGQVVERLARVPRLRVLRRADSSEPDATTIAMRVGDRLEVTAVHGQATLVLQLPLAIDLLESTADAIVRLVTTATELAAPAPRPRPALEALDLRLAAHHLVDVGALNLEEALTKLERANALVPDDPRTLAELAIVHVRRAFFGRDESSEAGIDRAIALAREAIERAPELVEARLAMGLVELNVGDVALAAAHFRIAIAKNPQSADAHEALGRLLLEAGFVDRGRARLEEALAIRPSSMQPRWDLERARLLQGDTEGHLERTARLLRRPDEFLLGRTRLAWWRRDLEQVAALRPLYGSLALFPARLGQLVDVILDGDWAARRDALLGFVRDDRSRNLRRQVFMAQLLVEVACLSGAADDALEMLEHAAAHGLFDLHWLERLWLLEPVRALPGYAAVHAVVKQRADAILDALYGDHGMTLADTHLAST